MHYVTVHNLLKRERGPASSHLCVGCGVQAQQWAYQYNGDPELYYGETRTPYSTDIHGCYAPMCRKCHRAFDIDQDKRVSLYLQNAGSRLGAITGSSKSNRVRRTCECGMVAHPGAIGSHQKASGHKSYRDS